MSVYTISLEVLNKTKKTAIDFGEYRSSEREDTVKKLDELSDFFSFTFLLNKSWSLDMW